MTMLFKRSPLKKKSTEDGAASLPLSTPRGTGRKTTGSSTLFGNDDVKQILTVTTGIMMVVLLALVSTSMSTSGFDFVALGQAVKEQSWTPQYNADSFPWKAMSRPASNPADRRRRTSFSATNREALSSSIFNDKTSFYSELRKSYESFFPPNHRRRSMEVVEYLQQYQLDAHPIPGYDIHNCPGVPPDGYPFQWNLLNDILAQWPADDTEPPTSATIYQGLCIFDFEKDYDKAMRYRNEELPFVVRGDPAVAQTVERWNTPYYLQALLGDVKQGAEYSDNSDFLYWTDANTHPEADWKPPTQHLEMTYSEWMEKANVTDDTLLQPGMPHYYLKVVGCAASRQATATTGGSPMPCTVLSGGEHVPYLTDEMPFYTQTRSSVYIKDTVEGAQTKAINCRFGMKGVKATNHFDGERNFVTVLQGVRRMILAHPNQCPKLALFPPGHPSARHSKVDWGNPDLEEFPEFQEAMANEVVMQPGDSLFLPSLWFHFIVSMSLNIQCNTRSGMDFKHVPDIDACGWA